MALIPPVGTSGIYTLAAPFNSLLQADMSYRCDAVRRISDFIEVGIDPFEEFYVANQLEKNTYDQDLMNQVCIISLVSSTGHWVYVPSTYILAYPDINGVPYTVMVLGVEIGAVPNYLNLAGFKQAIINLTRDTIGVIPTIREVAISAVQKLSHVEHSVLENARVLLVNNSQTDRAKLLAAQAELNQLRQQYDQLETYIRDLSE